MDPLAPTPSERAARARADLRLGLPVAIPGHLVLAAETAPRERVAALPPGSVLVLSARRAETLRARAYDGDVARVPLPPGATAAWARAAADPSTDLATPLKGPFPTLRDGDPAPARAALALVRSARLLPAALLAPLAGPPPEGVAAVDGPAPPGPLVPVAAARVPLALAGAARVHAFRDAGDGAEHLAVVVGDPPADRPVLARLHSACLTGDALGSLKCDCGPQLHAALAAMAGEGAGVLLYLDQEGRGIGLLNKLRAYALQDEGFDTVDANHRLGFEDDERDFRSGAEMLRSLGFASVRLLTNNPAKVRRLEEAGIEVAARVPLRVGRGPLNDAYLATKAARSGHLL